jgi:FkbM family methyltransferase
MFENLPISMPELKRVVLSESINSLKMNTFFDNFDAERFNVEGVDNSKFFNTSASINWITWFFENTQNIFNAFSLLKSDSSKRLFLNLIAFRIAGHHSVKIETQFNENSGAFEEYKKIEKSSPSRILAEGMLGTLKHYDFMYEGKHYIVDCLGLKYYLFRRQYFFEDGPLQVAPVEGDFVIDAGACLGDTSIVFGKAVGKQGKVFAFDPLENHIEVLTHNINQNKDCNILAIPYGLSDFDEICPPLRLQKYSPGFNSAQEKVPLRSLDSLVMDAVIPKIDFIKMDIEGAELSAIKGAASSIRKFRPKLAISLYHKPNDMFEIPLYISETFPFYDMYLGHYTMHNEETVLYCNPK